MRNTAQQTNRFGLQSKHFIVVFLLFLTYNLSAQVSINTDGTDPDANSIIHVKGDADNNNVLLQTGIDGGVCISPVPLIPSHLLHVYNNSSESVLRLEGPTGTYRYGAKLNFGDGEFAFIQEDLDDELQIYARFRTKIMGGNVGIGVDDPDAKLEINGQIKVTGGSPGENKVLTSDANGLASWEDATGGSTGGTELGPNYGTVVNPATGKTWLDRNLGASQVATSVDDAAAYGDLYQWGRAQEGHEDRNSATISGSPADTWLADEGSNDWDGKFMIYNANWIEDFIDNLWTGISAENNPCPSGFRIPTNAELNQERRTWSSNDAAGAFASPLKLTCGGYRDDNDGLLYGVDDMGVYWSSSAVKGGGNYEVNYARILTFSTPSSGMLEQKQDRGYSIRCIKN